MIAVGQKRLGAEIQKLGVVRRQRGAGFFRQRGERGRRRAIAAQQRADPLARLLLLLRVAIWNAGAVSAAAGLLIVVVLARLESASALPALAIGALYVARKAYLTARLQRRAAQVRLEDRFARHQLRPQHLRQCFFRTDHLWQSSRTLQGLQAALMRPLSPLLQKQEKMRRLRHHFQRAFAPLHTSLPALDLALFALAAAASAYLLPVAVLSERMGVMVALAAVLAAGELVHLGLELAARRTLGLYEENLARWTLLHRVDRSVRVSERPHYTHRIHYYARPWFGSSAA